MTDARAYDANYVEKLEAKVEALSADNTFLRAAALRADNIEKHRDELQAKVERLEAALQEIGYGLPEPQSLGQCRNIALAALKESE